MIRVGYVTKLWALQIYTHILPLGKARLGRSQRYGGLGGWQQWGWCWQIEAERCLVPWGAGCLIAPRLLCGLLVASLCDLIPEISKPPTPPHSWLCPPQVNPGKMETCRTLFFCQMKYWSGSVYSLFAQPWQGLYLCESESGLSCLLSFQLQQNFKMYRGLQKLAKYGSREGKPPKKMRSYNDKITSAGSPERVFPQITESCAMLNGCCLSTCLRSREHNEVFVLYTTAHVKHECLGIVGDQK